MSSLILNLFCAVREPPDDGSTLNSQFCRFTNRVPVVEPNPRFYKIIMSISKLSESKTELSKLHIPRQRVELAAHLVQRFPIAKDEIYRAHNQGIFEVMATSVVVQSILLAIECAPVECIEISRCSQCHCLLLSSPIWWRRGVLKSTSGSVRRQVKKQGSQNMKSIPSQCASTATVSLTQWDCKDMRFVSGMRRSTSKDMFLAVK